MRAVRLSVTGWIGLGAALVLALVLLAAVAAPLLVAGDPDAMVAPPLVPLLFRTARVVWIHIDRTISPGPPREKED